MPALLVEFADTTLRHTSVWTNSINCGISVAMIAARSPGKLAILGPFCLIVLSTRNLLTVN